MNLRYALIAGSTAFAGLSAVAMASCSSSSGPELQIGPGSGGSGAVGSSGSASSTGSSGRFGIVLGGVGGGSIASSAACVGLACQQTTCAVGACTQKACPGTASTTVSGTVYDPAGKVPLYNVVVYVPSAPVKPFVEGARCDRCDASVLNPLSSAITDTKGHFQLKDVPVGDNIPMVIEIGKWRRQITIPKVSACVDTPLTDPNLTRLPRNKGEGNIPLIAIATGSYDSMECLPRRIGIDDAEFTTDTGGGSIHLYSGADLVDGNGNHSVTKAFDASLNGGATFKRATSLWSSLDALKRYDIVILSCEGNPIEQEKPMSAREAMYAYASLGGRVFASHWHRIWYSHGPAPVPMVGTWQDRLDPPDPATGTVNTSFPKGQALADWLVNVGASAVPGQIEIRAPRDNLQAGNPAYATEWIRVPASGNRLTEGGGVAVEYLTFNAPLAVPSDQQCGRCVFTDLHVSSTGADVPGTPFPGGCERRELSPQEKAVEYMLFDLSSCVRDDREVPEPPR